MLCFKKNLILASLLFWVSSANAYGLHTVNTAAAALIASQEKGLIHFGALELQKRLILSGGKRLGKEQKCGICKRPKKDGLPTSYRGMPSGHVIRTWFPASYTRVFSEYKALSIPMYGAAIVMARHKVREKAHTPLQVISTAVLCELIAEINSRMEWSQNYNTTTFNISPEGAAINLKINF